MRVFRYTEWIARTPEEVWRFMWDFEQAPRWRALVEQMEAEREPLVQGGKVIATFQVNGGLMKREITLGEFDPPRVARLDSDSGSVYGSFRYTLEREQNGTRVHFEHDLRARGFNWLLWRAYARELRERYAEQLPRLKRAIEAA